MAVFSEFSDYDGLGLAELVRQKQVKPIELVEEAIERVERLNPRLNAVVAKMYDRARAAAGGEIPGGPFAGVPFLLKDLFFAWAGAPLTNGSRFFKDCVPDHDAELVKRMKESGLIIVGKTNTPELGLTPFTEPELFGPARNPWNLDRTPGGSSGGSGAAVAARVVPMASASDGGGSIRIPAACCGVFGLKPTRARTPSGPDALEIRQGASSGHVITISVRDSAAMLDATAGPEVGAPCHAPPPSRPYLQEVGARPGRLRIAFTSSPLLGTYVHPDCAEAVERTAKLLENLGHDVEEASPDINGEEFAKAFLVMVAGETWADIEEGEAVVGRTAKPEDFEASTWLFALFGKRYTSAEFALAMRRLRAAGRQVGRFFETYDVLLTPTLAKPPIPVGSIQPKGAEAAIQKVLARLSAAGVAKILGGLDAAIKQIFEFVPYTPVFNVTGQPAMSVPLEWNDSGLPIGLHFVGRFGDEATLFRLAAQLEESRPWAGRVPPICA